MRALHAMVTFVGVAAVVVFTFGSAASAAVLPGSDTSCDSGDFCLYQCTSGGGARTATPNAASTYIGYTFNSNTSVQLDNRVSSVQNRFNNYDVRLYTEPNYGGISQCFRKQSAVITNVIADINDRGSSHKGVSVC